MEHQKRARRGIRSVDDLLTMLDGWFPAAADRWSGSGGSWWDTFYADRDREVPFFADKPDEHLVEWLEQGVIGPGRALDLGCGPGRNALYLAGRGFEVEAIDLSREAIGWGRERARREGSTVEFIHGDAFGEAGSGLVGPHDLVYDSGCLHHLPPHRRISYLALLDRVLAPGGCFVVTCFAAGLMGSQADDAQVYRQGGLDGGLGFSPDDLRSLFGELTEVEIRAVRGQGPDSPTFGLDYLLAGLFRRPPTTEVHLGRPSAKLG